MWSLKAPSEMILGRTRPCNICSVNTKAFQTVTNDRLIDCDVARKDKGDAITAKTKTSAFPSFLCGLISRSFLGLISRPHEWSVWATRERIHSILSWEQMEQKTDAINVCDSRPQEEMMHWMKSDHERSQETVTMPGVHSNAFQLFTCDQLTRDWC